MRALVVDDEVDIRTLLIKMRFRRKLDIAEAVNGQDAIVKLDAGDFELLILDLMVPGTDGFAVLDHLIATRPRMLEETVVVMAYPRTAHLYGIPMIARVVFKPFDPMRFDDAVDACCTAASFD